jgi:hypothetical protein
MTLPTTKRQRRRSGDGRRLLRMLSSSVAKEQRVLNVRQQMLSELRIKDGAAERLYVGRPALARPMYLLHLHDAPSCLHVVCEHARVRVVRERVRASMMQSGSDIAWGGGMCRPGLVRCTASGRGWWP